MSHEKGRWYEHMAPKLAITAILGFVALYDGLCKPGNTISEQVDRWRENETTSDLTNWTLDVLYDHLKRNRPPEKDPIHRFARYFGKD